MKHGIGGSMISKEQAERQQEETVYSLAEIISGHVSPEDITLAKQIYRAITQDKVFGIKLAD